MERSTPLAKSGHASDRRKDASAPALSIVIPAYNEERRLPRTLDAVLAWAENRPERVEVIVAENGSTDTTAEVARQYASRHANVRVLSGLPRGKGIAVRRGMLEAKGNLRFLCDADLSMPIVNLDRFLETIQSGADVAIGSREAPGALRVGEPAHRHLMGRVFNAVVKALAVPGIEDTQCGFKMFTARAADVVFPKARLAGWGFDPEVLYVARKFGLTIREVPIEWHYDPDSRVRALLDPAFMVAELVRIRWLDLTGAYDG